MKTVSRFNITLSIPFSLICIVRAELDGRPLNTAIEWILFSSENNGTSEVKLEMHECFLDTLNILSVNESSSGCEIYLMPVSDFSGSGSGFSGSPPAVFGYQSVLNRTENGTDTQVTYRCQATAMNVIMFSDTTVYVEGIYISLQFRTILL